MKPLQKFLSAFIFVQLGAFCGRALAVYIDYARHKEIYDTYSAPWYTRIIIAAILTAITVTITIIVYFIVRYKNQRRQK